MNATRKISTIGFAIGAALLFGQSLQAQTRAPNPPAAAQQMMSPDDVFNRWDKNKNKSLTVEEFRTGWQEVQMSMAVRKLHDNFVRMDDDKNGSLEQAEYAKLELIKRAGNTAPMLSFYDQDKNGKLDFKEYVDLVNAMTQRK